jgi:hypothetical protein
VSSLLRDGDDDDDSDRDGTLLTTATGGDGIADSDAEADSDGGGDKTSIRTETETDTELDAEREGEGEGTGAADTDDVDDDDDDDDSDDDDDAAAVRLRDTLLLDDAEVTPRGTAADGVGDTDAAACGRKLHVRPLFTSTCSSVPKSDPGTTSTAPSPLTSATVANAADGDENAAANASKLLRPLLRSSSTLSMNDAAAMMSSRPSPLMSATLTCDRSYEVVVYSVTAVVVTVMPTEDSSSSRSLPPSPSLSHSSTSPRPLPSKSTPQWSRVTVCAGVYGKARRLKATPPAAPPSYVAANQSIELAPVSTSTTATTMSSPLPATLSTSHTHTALAKGMVATTARADDSNAGGVTAPACHWREPLLGHHSTTSTAASAVSRPRADTVPNSDPWSSSPRTLGAANVRAAPATSLRRSRYTTPLSTTTTSGTPSPLMSTADADTSEPGDTMLLGGVDDRSKTSEPRGPLARP